MRQEATIIHAPRAIADRPEVLSSTTAVPGHFPLRRVRLAGPTMNDPHVKALLYRVEHASTFNYEQAEPFDRDFPEFHIRIESEHATAEPKRHFATAEEAREVVESFLRAWELDAALTRDNPDVLRFVYLRPEIVDRNPPPGSAVLYPQTGQYVLKGHEATLCLGLKEYPEPPSGLTISPEVAAMFDRWSRYKVGQALLGDTADFCRGALERGVGRQSAADHYGIDRPVIDKLGDLVDRKGGPQARKYKGFATPYTEPERAWLEAALKKVIRRAAETAYHPDASRGLITMEDLPPL